MSTIKFPFGKQDVQNLSPDENVVDITVSNMSTFVNVSKLAANTTINVAASDSLKSGAELIVRTFNVNDATYNITWGSGFYAKNVDGVSNKAHYSTFVYDGDDFVQTSTQEADRDELETVSAAVEFYQTGSTIVFNTEYTNSTDVNDDWVVDSVFRFNQYLPHGTEITLEDATGEYTVSGSAVNELWLSDILQSVTSSFEKRPLLNSVTESVDYIFTITGSIDTYESTVYVRSLASNTTDSASYQSDEEMTDINILTEVSALIVYETEE